MNYGVKTINEVFASNKITAIGENSDEPSNGEEDFGRHMKITI
jgi:hypothetical protein